MFSWEQVDDLWATKSEAVGLIVCAISFQDFQPMWSLCGPDPTTSQTDSHRQTDGMRLQDLALHYSASGGKKLVRQSYKYFCVSCSHSYDTILLRGTDRRTDILNTLHSLTRALNARLVLVV